MNCLLLLIGNDMGNYDKYENMIEASETARQLLESSKSLGLSVCSLTAQRNGHGRLGRSTTDEGQNYDSIVVNSVCKADGIGLSQSDECLKNLADGGRGIGQIDEEEEEYICTVLRAQTCVAVMKLLSSEKGKKEEYINILKKCAKEGDAYSMLNLALMHDWGLNGVEQDKERAMEMYEKSEHNGLSDARLLLSSITMKKKMNPLFRIKRK